MKTRAQRKADEKRYEQERQVAETIVDIRTGRETVENLAKTYFDYAVEAAEMGQDEYANELLETIVELEDFASDLKATELDIETTAVLTSAMAKLSSLPAAFSTLQTIFKQAPNFSKMKANITTLREQLRRQRQEFKEFRKGFGRSKDTEVDRIFGSSAKSNAFSDRLKEKQRALEATLITKGKGMAAPTAAAPAAASQGVTAQDAARVDAIAAVLDEEKKRD